MKKVFVLLILFSSVSLWAQKGNYLETIYFRNPQYVLQMDKVMYPGYEIKFQNIELHEYLNNKKVSTTPFSDISTTRENDQIYMDDLGTLPLHVEEGLQFSYNATLDKEYNIKSEYFEELIITLGRNETKLTRLLPAKAQNLADSLLSNYKKVEVRKTPVYDKKGRPIGTEAIAGDVQVYERGYFDVRHNRVVLAGRENAYRYIDNSQEIDGKKGILTLDTEHLVIYDINYLEDDEEYLPTKKVGAIYQLKGSLQEYTIVKTEDSFEDIINDPMILEMVDLGGADYTLQDFIWITENNEAIWLAELATFKRAWEYTAVGDLLHLPYTIEFVGVSSDNGVKSEGLPLVEHIIESRPLREDEVFDADGNVYETTLIGDRRWMKENLRSEHFQDGSEIPNLTTSQWATSTMEGIIIDEDMDVTLANKGHRYNGYTVVSEKNVCPYGFYVPDEYDIAELYNDVTPYNEYIKIKGNGTVKEFRYSPLLAPVVWPVATALNVAWNSIALGADITLLAGAGAIDLTYNTPWFLADLFILGPILGWEKETDEKGNTKTKYNPLPTFKGNGGFHLFTGFGDLLSEVNGLFYYFRSAPYQPKSKYDYSEFEEGKIRLPVKTKSRYLPVIAQLFKKDDRFKDNYDFGLEVGNGIDFPNRQVPKSIKKVRYSNNLGLAYKNWELPALWGISLTFRDSYHELNAVPSYYPEDDFKLLKMRTAIRCVNDPFYEAPEDNY